MDNIDIFNDSAIILERKVPKKIKSWITINLFQVLYQSSKDLKHYENYS